MEGGVYPLTCARLRSLNLVSHRAFSYNRWATALKQILSRLTLPELTTLRVDCMSREEADTFTSIRELITTRSYCPITVLYFDHGIILEDDILHILRTTPTLEDVRLTHVDVSLDKTLAELTPKFDGTTVLVPRLKVLHTGGNIVFDIDIFVNMVEARWNIPPLNFTSMQRLKEVHVYRLLEVNGWDSDGTSTDGIFRTGCVQSGRIERLVQY